MPEIKTAKVLVPYKTHLASDCPNCGRNILDYVDVNWEKECDEYYKITNFHPYFDGEFSGHEWTVECICPYCDTEFSYINGDV
jgi:uncharacterized Zn-finger protein